jgi:hypothetical protein
MSCVVAAASRRFPMAHQRPDAAATEYLTDVLGYTVLMQPVVDGTQAGIHALTRQ